MTDGPLRSGPAPAVKSDGSRQPDGRAFVGVITPAVPVSYPTDRQLQASRSALVNSRGVNPSSSRSVPLLEPAAASGGARAVAVRFWPLDRGPRTVLLQGTVGCPRRAVGVAILPPQRTGAGDDRGRGLPVPGHSTSFLNCWHFYPGLGVPAVTQPTGRAPTTRPQQFQSLTAPPRGDASVRP
jgi:hypothetical protein